MIDYRKNNTYKVYSRVSPNNKIYIGVTNRSLEKRAGTNGINYKNSPCFYNAILKYGWNNFEHTILADNLTESEAFNFEKILINKLNSNNKEYGYNISAGGVGGNRKKEIPVTQYSKNREYVATFKSSAEASRYIGIDRTRITNCCKGKSKTASGFIWEYADSKNIKKADRKNQKKVYQYDKNMNFIGEYESVKVASENTNIPLSSISKCVTRVNNYAYGYIFLYEFIER